MLYWECTLAHESLSHVVSTKISWITCADPGPDPPPPWKITKHRVFKQYMSGSAEKSQLRSQHSMLGIHWHASETPFNGVSLAGRWWPAYSGTWILPPLINFKNKRCQSWIPSDKTFWIRAWIMSVDSLISIEPVHTHCMHARIQNICQRG